ncbi:hypothetical protein Pyrfu_1656 [Pyrolobus fumarii 1A]|uniref:Uncharacterized protein n=1 Tax=Pyrolobus fumarii (strain DSM 11204 / 1A) TaxID=694429 RepID=G0ECE2_PYRF1|nr:hypothetical protein [Pyrolobus fumarii]AEM39512.1 hypothetical protein Pyrfu_1656 [Pyrolobus fumarii 1A]
MAKRKRVVRLFFNTFYEDLARRIEEELSRRYEGVKFTRSRVLPEFYYVEISVSNSSDLERIRVEVEELVKKLGGDLVFGVKAYTVET